MEKKHALIDFSFSLHEGVYGMLGPNGAGKSTLMHLITGNLLPDRDGGRILWNEQPIQKLGKEYRKQLGFMPQQQELYRNMTARMFLGYIAALKCIPKQAASEQVNAVLEQVELSEDADHKLGEFSGGMKQRVLIASAILGDPALIVMDEPTAGLDPKQRVLVREMIHRLSKHKIIIVSTHIVSDIETIADEILMMQSGTLLTHGSPAQLAGQVKVGTPSLESLYMEYYGGQ